MKTKLIRKTNNRSPRIIYTSGIESKSNIEYTDNLFVGKEIDYTNYNPQNGWNWTYRTPIISDNASGEFKRFMYILWFMRNRQIQYVYYMGNMRTWQEVIKDKKGNCCDLVNLVNVMAGQSGMATECGTPITTKRFIKDQIWQDGTSYYHVFNELTIDNKKLLLDPTNYILTGNVLPLGRWIGTIQNPIYEHHYGSEIFGDNINPVATYTDLEDPCL